MTFPRLWLSAFGVCTLVALLPPPAWAQDCGAPPTVAEFEAQVTSGGGTVAGRIDYPGTIATGILLTIDPVGGVALWTYVDRCMKGGPLMWDKVNPARVKPETEGTPA